MSYACMVDVWRRINRNTIYGSLERWVSQISETDCNGHVGRTIRSQVSLKTALKSSSKLQLLLNLFC